MPDHVHALVHARAAAADFHRFVRLAKQRSGFGFARALGGRLWQDSFFDRTVRENESVVEIINYIIANPVRAGLVRTPGEYPYWGSQIHSREEILDFIAIESGRTHCRV
jgi:REP element-mobilizing transposase RayT